MHVLLCIVTGRYSSRLYIAYAPLVSTIYQNQVMSQYKKTEVNVNSFNAWKIHTSFETRKETCPEKAEYTTYTRSK